MKMFKTLMTVAVAMVATLGLAGMASAATIACGDCHGLSAKTPAYESKALPTNADNCAGDARGLHGVHGNYSSASYKMNSTSTTRGTCSYCHTSSGGGAPTATHNNGYANVTGSVITGKQAMVTTGLDYDQGTSTCTSSCHKNEAATAKWGNYTSTATIKLTCNSCHDDSSASTMTLSGAHAAHLGTNVTVTGLGAGTNADCAACHPDNTGDLWKDGKADDGSKKAYPHASDGTFVVSANASLNAGLSHTTCTNACHNNVTTDDWSATSLTCTSCHSDSTGAGTDLGGSHPAHFAAGKVCSDCHGTLPTDTAHASALPVASDNAAITLVAGTFDDGLNSCSGTGAGCHLTGTPVWGSGTLDCTGCHEYPTSSNEWSTGNGHLVRYDSPVTDTHMKATGYNFATDTYDDITADNTRCGFCHSGGTHRSGTVDVTSTGKGYNYCAPGDYTINVNATGTNVTCSNVSCHSGVDTPNWY